VAERRVPRRPRHLPSPFRAGLAKKGAFVEEKVRHARRASSERHHAPRDARDRPSARLVREPAARATPNAARSSSVSIGPRARLGNRKPTFRRARARTPQTAHLHFDMLACFARGSGLDCRGGKRQRIRLRMEGHHSYLANASPGTAKRARGRGGLDGALPECVFLASTAFPRFFPASDSREPPPSPPPTEEEEQVYAQLATLKEHLPTRYAPRRPANARVERTPHLPSTRRSAGCRTHSPSFRLFFLFLEINGSYPEHRARPARRESKRAPLRPSLARARI
jgi:hypothetical protein